MNSCGADRCEVMVIEMCLLWVRSVSPPCSRLETGHCVPSLLGDCSRTDSRNCPRMIPIPGFCSSKVWRCGSRERETGYRSHERKNRGGPDWRSHGPQGPRGEETLPHLLSVQRSDKTSVWKAWVFHSPQMAMTSGLEGTLLTGPSALQP